MKKLRFYISSFMKEILNQDRENFDLEIGSIGNRIFTYYSNKDIEKIDLKGKETIQFNLNKKNEDMMYQVLKEHTEKDKDILISEAEYMKRAIYTYMNNPKYIREEILFQDKFSIIRDTISKGKKLNIKYNGIVRTVSPYFIKVADRENRNYLFCYCEKNEDYRTYKISHIETIMESREDLEKKDKKYIEDIEKNFDPFLSYGKEVRVKFTDRGKKIFEKAINTRPKLLESSSEIYVFECDEKLAEVYFGQFFEEVEILEPESLREYFKKKFEKSYEIYKE